MTGTSMQTRTPRFAFTERALASRGHTGRDGRRGAMSQVSDSITKWVKTLLLELV